MFRNSYDVCAAIGEMLHADLDEIIKLQAKEKVLNRTNGETKKPLKS